MCDMVNAFIPTRHVALAPSVRDLDLGYGNAIQRDLALHFAGVPGTILTSTARCLCGFADWDALLTLARDLAVRNAVDFVAVLSFVDGDRRALTEIEFDIDDDAARVPIAARELVVLHNGPVEQRRHRRLLRGLAAAVGREVTLRLKNRAVLRGALAFDPASEVGAVGNRTFVAAQVHELADE